MVAFDRPDHLRRLIAALDPLPVYLHIDAGTPRATFDRMVADLPSRVRLLPRLRSRWGSFEVVRAELSGYRAAAAEVDFEHVVMLSGADYPLTTADRLQQFLAAAPGRSFLELQRLPLRRWGMFAGYDRFALWQRAVDRRRVALPLPLLKPRGLRLAGGSTWKILSRRHADLVLDAFATDHRLARYFSRCWIPEEVAIPSVLLSPARGGDADTGAFGPTPWVVNWRASAGSSPAPFADLEEILQVAESYPTPALFARKFDDSSGPLLDRIDQELRVS
nr:beta-1,6-N-acetylglucosaminyltransferase [Flexivirga meconopsidis]